MAAEKVSGVTIEISADSKSLVKQLNQVDKEISKTGKTVDALEKSLQLEWNNEKFIGAQKLAQQAVDESTKKIQLIKKELASFDSSKVNTKDFKALQEELLKTESNAVVLKKRLEEINDLKINHLSNKFKDIGDSISHAGKKLIAVSAGAAAAVAGMTVLFNSSVKSAGELDDLSQSVSLNAEALQKWRYIAIQLGLDNATLQTALAKTQAAFSNMAMGEVNPAAKALETLGFNASEAAKGMDANFEEMILRLSQVSESSEKAYLTNELFGHKLGSKVIPLLNGGAEGLKQLTLEFESMGYMTNEQVSMLADYDDQWTLIKGALTEVKNQLAVSLLPFFQSITTYIQEKVVPSVKSLAEWFGGLSERTKGFITSATVLVALLSPILLTVGKLTSSLGSIIPIVSKLRASLGSLVGIPVVGWIVAIIALIATLYATNEEFRESINNLVSTIASALMPILEVLTKLISSVFQAIMPLINALGSILSPIIQILTNIITPLISILNSILLPVIHQLDQAFKAIEFILKPIIGLISMLGEAFSGVSKVIANVIGWMISKVLNPFLKYLEDFVNFGIDIFNGLIESINHMTGWLGISLKKINHVELQIKSPAITDGSKDARNYTNNQNVNHTVDNAINKSNVTNNHLRTTNYDNSSKTFNIEVVVQNYSETVDVDEMVRKINLKLAEQM